jgi:hypothetical protein
MTIYNNEVMATLFDIRKDRKGERKIVFNTSVNDWYGMVWGIISRRNKKKKEHLPYPFIE